MRFVLGIGIGAVIGGLLGYFGQCTSGACPLTANPFRGAIYGAVVGFLFALTVTSGERSTKRGLDEDRTADTPAVSEDAQAEGGERARE